MVWIYQYLRYFLFKPFLIHVQPLKFSQDCIDKFFFLNKAVAASLIAFSFLPVSAVPRFMLDCVTVVRRLKELGIPVIFEKEGMIQMGLLHSGRKKYNDEQQKVLNDPKWQ